MTKTYVYSQLETVLKFGLHQLLGSTESDDSDLMTHLAHGDADFAAILGETEAATGHWLPPKSVCDPEICRNRGWVVLTDEPFVCETSPDDQRAVQVLQEGQSLLLPEICIISF